MENADKVITAYSGLTIPQATVLGIFLIIIVGVIAWLISSYGLTFKGLTIGGSKKILESSRHDSFLIEDLRIAIEKIDQSLAVDLKLLAKRKKHDLIKSLGTECFFVGFCIGYAFEEILTAYFTRSDFVPSLARGSRQSLVDVITNKLIDAYKDDEFRLKSSPCSVKYPDFSCEEKVIRNLVLDFFEEAAILSIGSLERKIKTYEEHLNSFKDPFFKENACTKKIRETRSLLESIE